MKTSMSVFTLVIAVALATVCAPSAMAGQGGAQSITITIDPVEMPVSLLHPGDFFSKSKTLTVYDFVIRDYSGNPIDGFIIKSSEGQTLIPISTVKEVRMDKWIHKNTGDIEFIHYVANGKMVLTDNTKLNVLMNADFGTIEGRTDLGDFFLGDPHKVRRLVFNRAAPMSESKVEPEMKMEPEVKTEPEAKTEPEEKVALEAKSEPETNMEPEAMAESEASEAEVSQSKPDSDGDGVTDDMDQCPNTPKGAVVNAAGCWTIKGVNFDYNKYDIKPEYYGVMDENAQVLEMNPAVKIEIQGHTDSIASEQYNQALSEKRAESAKDYFMSKGVNGDRISTRGFGELKPITTNDTPEGRAQNRRIEIEITGR